MLRVLFPTVNATSLLPLTCCAKLLDVCNYHVVYGDSPLVVTYHGKQFAYFVGWVLTEVCFLTDGALSPSTMSNGEEELDPTVTYKPGQLAQVMADPDFIRQLRGHRGSKAPEAGHIHLTPDTDPENTFRTRQRNQRPRVKFEELFAPEDLIDVNGSRTDGPADAVDQQNGQDQV